MSKVSQESNQEEFSDSELIGILRRAIQLAPDQPTQARLRLRLAAALEQERPNRNAENHTPRG